MLPAGRKPVQRGTQRPISWVLLAGRKAVPGYSAVNQSLDNQKDQQCRQEVGDIAAHVLWKFQPFAGVGFFLIVFISPAKAGDAKQQIAE